MGKKQKDSIKNRVYSMTLSGEHSTLKYEVTASRYIIDEMHKAIERIFNDYPKTWEEK